MTKHVRNTYITPRDLLHRESSLCDYCQTAIEQAELLLVVMRENYGTSFVPWSHWVASLASVKHQMEGRSLLLCSTAKLATKPMHARSMSYSRATMICSALFGVKNESTPPVVRLGDKHGLAPIPALRHARLPSSYRPLAYATWPNEEHETQRREIAQRGY